MKNQKTIRGIIIAIIICMVCNLLPLGFLCNTLMAQTFSYNNDSNKEVYAEFLLEEQVDWGGGKQMNKYKFVLHNNAAQSICNWKIEITFPGAFPSWESGWGWCANVAVSGNTMTITPGDGEVGGGAIAAGSTYESAGFFVYTNIADFSNVTVAYDYGNSSLPPVSTDFDVNITGQTKDIDFSLTPVGQHGKLSVNGTHLVDQKNQNFQLRGVSTHGINWDCGYPYVNKTAFHNLRDEWGVNAVRLAMYTVEYNGYCAGGDQNSLKNLIDNGISYATELGMYAIIDWHILKDLTPQTHKESAKAFFADMSEKYADYNNVLYEICNEPNGETDWEEIKSYAEEIIPIIRNNDPDAIIIVGTPNWSQDVDIVSQNPIQNVTNVMYTIHFYSNTHKLEYRNKMETALQAGLPVFCTEYGVCDSSGEGSYNFKEANAWLDLMDEYEISYFCWAFTNKNEAASLLRSTSSRKNGFLTEDLSKAGQWLIYEYNKRTGNTTTPKPPVTDEVDAFVTRMYTTALNREGDADGIAYWVQELCAGNRSGAMVCETFLLGTELEDQNISNDEFLNRCYATLYDRTADEEGFNYWIKMLNNGVSRRYVMAGFINSLEYQTMCANYKIEPGTITLTENRDQNHNVTMYIYRCYDRTLMRAPEVAGLNYWTGAILTGEKQAVDVARQIVSAPEFVEHHYSDEEYVKILYRMFFDREYDQAGLDFWLESMQNGMSRAMVLESFANVEEFKVVLKGFGL